MAGAVETIGWILTIDDSDFNDKLDGIRTAIDGMKDSFSEMSSDSVASMGNQFQDMDTDMEEMGTSATKFGKILGAALSSATGGLNYVLEAVITVLKPFLDAAMAVIDVLTAGLMKIVGVVVKVLQPFLNMFNDFFKMLQMAFEPVFMVFRMVLVPLMYNFMPLITKTVAEVMIWILDGVMTVIDVFLKWYNGGWGAFWKDLQGLGKDIWAKVKVYALKFWNWLSTDGLNMLINALKGFFKWYTTKWIPMLMKAAWGFVKWLITKGLPKLWEKVLSFVGWFADEFWPKLKLKLADYVAWVVEDGIPQIWDKILSFTGWFADTGWPAIKESITDAIEWVIDTAPRVWKSWSDWWMNTAQPAIGKGLLWFWDKLKYGFSATWEWIKESMNTAIEFLGLGNIGEKLSGIWKTILDLVKVPVRIVKNVINNNIIGTLNKLINELNKALDYVPGLGAKTLNFNIPKLAEGGVISRPTLALVGEAGPEAVVPLPAKSVSDAEAKDWAGMLGGVLQGSAIPLSGGATSGGAGKTVQAFAQAITEIKAVLLDIRNHVGLTGQNSSAVRNIQELLSSIVENTDASEWVNDPDFQIQNDRDLFER